MWVADKTIPERFRDELPPRTDVSMSAILFTTYCTKTVFSVLICHSIV